MRRGSWYQFGDRSQRLAQELLEAGIGVGVILSPRDLTFAKACQYAEAYKSLGAEVLIDLQFYVPDFSNSKMETYPTNEYRLALSDLARIPEREATALAGNLERIESALRVDAVLAPALAYESGRHDLDELNARLFQIGKAVGDNLGIPTYSTVVLGNSATTSGVVLQASLSQATSLDADGWYYAFEFSPERIPSDASEVLRCIQAGLTLACTGRPVLHAYAGPMALLSHCFGATGAAVGHCQNLWRFSRDRWEAGPAQGGGGDAPPRFFSSSLWGTVIYPDETAQLTPALRAEVITPTEYSAQVTAGLPWDRWDANKHFMAIVGRSVGSASSNTDPLVCAATASSVLERATTLHGRIAATGVILRDNTFAYQNNWRRSLQQLVTESRADFEYLSLLP